MVAFVFLVAASISLFVLAFISAKYAFENLRGKKNYVVELFLSSIFVTINLLYEKYNACSWNELCEMGEKYFRELKA